MVAMKRDASGILVYWERVAMKNVTPQKGRLVAVLVLLALLTYLAVHRNGLTSKDAEDEVVGDVVKVEDMALHDDHSTVAFVGLVALFAFFAFVIWTALRANKGEDTAMPPGRESSASDKTAPR
jgi:hypothetical protein